MVKWDVLVLVEANRAIVDAKGKQHARHWTDAFVTSCQIFRFFRLRARN